MEIFTKASTEKEEAVKLILEEVLAKYKVPNFTSQIIIDEKSIPHSHPVLTLNTRNSEPLFILKTLVHEQFHWFAQGTNYNQCVAYLKKYPDLGDCNSKRPNSFWTHLIVCWNTRNFLQQTLKKEEVDFAYTDSRSYHLTEKFVAENFEELRKDLEPFGMVYKC